MKDAFTQWYAEVIETSKTILTEEQEASLENLDNKKLGVAILKGYAGKKIPAEMATKIATML